MRWPGLVILGLILATRPTASAEDRIRLVVLTDISSVTAGQAEPDDGQSLIRLMLYTNEFDVEGLVATSNLGHGQRVRPDLIERVIDAYAAVRPNLVRHDERYPDPASLRPLVKSGQPVAGPKIAVERSVGPGRDTEASDWLIELADRPDPRPIWVLIWGGSADLAQSLDRVRRTRSPEQLSQFVSKLRVHSIGDQDSTGPWIRHEFPGLPVITQQRAYRGMYRGGDPALASSSWVKAHARGHGALGDLYPDYNGGDIWSRTLGPVRGIKEGDTPSFLALVPNGLTDRARPELGSWGGRFLGVDVHQVDVADPDLVCPDDPDPRMSSVHRWRPDFQADFEARLDWCVRPFHDANHPPKVVIEGNRLRRVRPGQSLILDAGPSQDPDGDPLEFRWSVYPDEDGAGGSVVFASPDRPRTEIRIREDVGARLVPILVTVRDGGKPSLTRYGRVLLDVGRDQ